MRSRRPTRRVRATRRRSASKSSATSGPGSRPRSPFGRGPPPGSPPVRRLPAGADAVVPVEATTPLDARRGARSARSRRDRAAPRRLSRPRGRAGRRVRRGTKAATCERATRCSRPARRSVPPVSHCWPGRASSGSRSTAGRGSPCSRPATRSGRRARTSGRPASRTPTGPDSGRRSSRRVPTPSTSGSRVDDLDDVLARLRRGLEAGADALIVSGGVSVGPYDVVKTAIETIGAGRPLAGRGPAGQAVRVRDGARGPAGGRPVLLFGLPGQPGLVRRHLRAVRPTGHPAAGGPDATLVRPVDRGGARRTRHEEPRPSCVPARRRATRRRRGTGPRRARPGLSCASRAGRGVTSSPPWPPPTRWRSFPKPTTPCRRAPRSPSGGSTSPDRRRIEWTSKPAPRAERRRLSHVDRTGRPRMVDVSDKPVTARRAVAEAAVAVSPETMSLVIDGGGPKGDVLSVAELAGVMGAKRTSELIPLCHPLAADRPRRCRSPRTAPRACSGSAPRPRRPARPASRWRR